MSRCVRVNLHSHSTYSDGSMSPEAVADCMAAAGVRFASLADHDTTEGLIRFEHALYRHGIGFLSGVEINVDGAQQGVHILAYGFDPENRDLQELLAANRRQSMANRPAANDAAAESTGQARDLTPEGLAGVERVARVIHRAGGLVFLAHPLTACADIDRFEGWLDQLKAAGLDGIEAVYGAYSAEVQAKLCGMAERHGLLVSAGSDFHGSDHAGLNRAWVDCPAAIWERFGRAMRLPAAFADGAGDGKSRRAGQARQIAKSQGPDFAWKRFVLRIVFPTVLAIGLFVATIFAIVIPVYENGLMDRKREMIRELTNSACSTLDDCRQDAIAGRISDQEARQRAIKRIEALRYGKERKDYFWITDMLPRMIVHPYRKDLNGADLRDFKDVRGTKLFVEFVSKAREHGEGYVQYYWQWKDNPDRVAPKESYVRRYEPWDWVIGTGIYLDDVHEEIARLTGRLVRVCLLITGAIAVLLIYIAKQTHGIEKRRSQAERELRESHEKYAALVHAATEGTLMVLDGRCAYANHTMAQMLGYTEQELSQLSVRSLFAQDESGEAAMERITSLAGGKTEPPPFEAQLSRKDGGRIDAVIAGTRVALAGKSGFILVAKDISRHRSLEEQLGESREKFRALTDRIDIGVFRTTADADPTFIEANPAARRCFGFSESDGLDGRKLLETLAEGDRAEIAAVLAAGGDLQNRIVHVPASDGSASFLSISMVLAQNEHGQVRCYDGIVEDITHRRKSEAERDTLIEQLQTSLLFLNEPLRNSIRPMQTCDMNAPIQRAAALMSRSSANALAITSADGQVVGILTDRDLRQRVLVEGGDVSRPVFEAMSSPVISLPDNSPVYEAVLKMQERSIGHLGVRDAEGRIISIIRNTDLFQFHKYSSAVITSEIQRSRTIYEIVDARTRLPGLVKSLLDCGARTRNVNRITTRLGDAIVERLIDLAAAEIGSPPGKFCFLAMGSEGRGEQTLLTDQDNAIIYEDAADADAGRFQDYYLQLGQRVCAWLDQAGYALCKGNVMARNPRWCKPVGVWKKYFADWITGANPQDLLEFNVFFDFRCVSGDRDLARELRQSIRPIMDNNPPFFIHFAQNALLYKPPVGFFGQIVVESGGQSPNTFNIKEATMPIVNFARLYALRHRVEETNTLDRLHKLHESGVLKKDFFEEVEQAYTFLMQTRLNHQTLAIGENRMPDNLVNPKALTHMDQSMLKQTFSLISTIRKKISYDFLGMA